jgi:putative DNA primase/helicase
LQRWRTTDNALEAIAAQHSDALLILDELAQVDPKTAGECAYMLANEQSKARSTRTGSPRARLAWRLLFLSAGELGLADHMMEGMKRARTGQEVRMVDIPADAGKGLGAFEDLHGDEGGAVFSRRITHGAMAKYGSAGRAFIEWACTQADNLPKRVKQGITAFLSDCVPSAASGQVQRVGARFAIVAVAGELATEAGITGWQKGESSAAAKTCFDAWLDARGGTGNGEIAAMLKQVKNYLELHGAGRFTMWHRAADDHAPNTLSRAGFRRMLNADGEPIKTNAQHGAEYGDKMHPQDGENVSYDFFILDSVFKKEVCQGFDYKAVCAALVAHGCLKRDKEQYATLKRLPSMGNARCFHVTAKIFELDL